MSKRNLVIILLISLVLGWQLLRPGYYSMHDDLQVMRLFEMDRCFKDGQIPCRWVPDLGQNFGQPLFNYYSAFPYYLGELFHLTGFSFVNTVKLLFLLSLFLSGVFVFLLAKIFLSEKAALVTAVAYMAVPYHAVDIFVRGASAESWGLTLTPLVLYMIIRTCTKPSKMNSILLALSLGAFLTTHNITVLISAPLLIVIGLYFFFTNQDKRKQLAFLFPGVLLGIGLSAFFLFPVLFERSYIQINYLTSDYFDFRAHFTTIAQLFTKLSWGYGPSRYNSYQYPETLSFFVGLVPIVSLLLTPLLLWLKRGDKKTFFPILMTCSLALFYLFMTHARSIFIWQNLPVLSIVQFPWRFLGPASLLTSLLIGFSLDCFTDKPKIMLKIAAFVIAFLIAANFSYFRFEKYYPNMTDAAKLTGAGYDIQIKGALLDYLPVASQKIPQTKAPGLPQIIEGQAGINYFDKRSNYFSSEFDINVDTATIRFPIVYFPGWTMYQNRQATPVAFDIKNDYGQITIKLNKGHQLVQTFFENTPVRAVANLITFFSALTTIVWLTIRPRSLS